MKAERPSWDSYFMELARVVASRSTCDRAHVGCVIVRDRRVLTTGYNGSPAGLPHCSDVGHKMENGHCVRTLHAEQNAIIQGALHGISTYKADMYLTHKPCYNCAKMIVNAGIVRVVHGGGYYAPGSLELLKEAGIQVQQMDPIP